MSRNPVTYSYTVPVWRGMLFVLLLLQTSCSYQVDQQSVVGSAGVRAQVAPGASLQRVNLIELAPIEDQARVSPEIVKHLEGHYRSTAREQLGGVLSTQGTAKGERVDAIAHLTLQRYLERQGGEIGAVQGASVAFIVELRSVREGAQRSHDSSAPTILWRASYVWVDKPVSDNILQIQQKLEAAKGGFRTAEEIFRQGVTTSFSQLNSAREEAFLHH